MAWRIQVGADYSEKGITGNPAIVGVRVPVKKGGSRVDDLVSFIRGSTEGGYASATLELHYEDDRTLNKVAKSALLVLRLDSGPDVEVPTDGEYEVDEVF